MTSTLTTEQIDHYQTQGYLVLEGWLSNAWLDRLNAVTQSFVEASRSVSESDKHDEISTNDIKSIVNFTIDNFKLPYTVKTGDLAFFIDSKKENVSYQHMYM